MSKYSPDAVVPDLDSHIKDRDSDVLLYLIKNYTVFELAGAYLNATSGGMYDRLVELSRAEDDDYDSDEDGDE